MAVDAVSSSSVAYAPQAQVRTERTERPEPPQTRPQEAREPRAEEQQRPQPVTNLQGQQTGTVINTTA